MSPALRRKFRTLHRWAGWVLGVQVLLWFLSGLFMTLPPIERVRGAHLLAETKAPAPLDGEVARRVLAEVPEATALAARTLGGRTVVEARTQAGPKLLEATGEPVRVDEGLVRDVASARYAGEGRLAAVEKLYQAPLDWRGSVPIWQARFEDAQGTRFYIDPETANVRRVRTRLWRVFDTMWMLHIMGYSDRDDFNTWWLRLAALAGLLFTVTGLVLLVPRRKARA